MRVAAVQVATTLCVEENRRLATRHVGAAAQEGASLVVLPEATMCGFGDASFDLSSVAETLDGPFVSTLSEAAAQHGVTVVAGMFERAPVAGKVYNTAVVIGPRGLLGAYRKLHLFDAYGARESARVVAGDASGPSSGVVTVPLGGAGEGAGGGGLVLGVMTCYDLRFPEMARALVERGATVIALPAHWFNGPGKAAVWATLVRARAIESTAYVVAAGKPEDEGVGHSMVVDPAGEVLAELGGTCEGGSQGTDMALAEVSAARVAEVRAALPVLAHRRFGVVARADPPTGLRPPPAGPTILSAPG